MAKGEGVKVTRGVQFIFGALALGLAIYSLKYYAINTQSTAVPSISMVLAGCSLVIVAVSHSKPVYFSRTSFNSAIALIQTELILDIVEHPHLPRLKKHPESRS
jgi:hypothetical protein